MGRDEQDARGTMIGTGAVLLSLLSMNLGAAFAKTLFPLVGAPGVAALRILLAAIVLLVAARMALGLGWRPDEIFTIEVR